MNFDYVIVVPTYPSSNEIEFSIAIAKELTNRGHAVGIIIKEITGEYNEKEFEFGDIPHWDFDKANKSRLIYSNDTIKRIENTYNIPSLRNFYFTELIYNKAGKGDFFEISNDYESEHLLKKTLYVFQVLEHFLDENNVKFFIHLDFGGEIFRRAVYHIGKVRGIPSIYLRGLPIKDRFALISNEMDYLDSLVVKPYDQLSLEEIEDAKRFLEDFRKQKKMALYHRENKENIPYKIKRKYQKDRERGVKRIDTIKYYIQAVKERTIKKAKYSHLWHKADYTEKYIFFPLHYHCESILTFRNAQFWRQEWIVEYVARSLPDGYKLYVKPHPAYKMSFPYNALKEITKISNVVLIDPGEHPHRLIENSSAVVVIASTTGFEAILYGKNVVCLGKVFYRGLGLTIDVDNLWDLSDALNKALGFELKNEDVIRFISSLKASSYEGKTLYDFGPNGEKLFLDDGNIKKVVDAYVDFSRRIGGS
jgi:hypothetical protein